MKISAKTDYACRAILELSLSEAGQAPLQAKIIAKRQKIPIKFLVHILIQLKQLGYVDSIRGKNGGYVLLKKPFEVKLKDIIHHFEGLGFSQLAPKSNGFVMEAVWQQVQNALQIALGDINFEEIRNRYVGQLNTIVYDI